MYRCAICTELVQEKQIRFPLYREDGSLQTEVPVCTECEDDLGAGVPLEILKAEMDAYLRQKSRSKKR